VHMYIYIYMCICTYIYMCVCIYIYIHTHTHTYIYIFLNFLLEFVFPRYIPLASKVVIHSFLWHFCMSECYCYI
jgi:hypothetical protein